MKLKCALLCALSVGLLFAPRSVQGQAHGEICPFQYMGFFGGQHLYDCHDPSCGNPFQHVMYAKDPPAFTFPLGCDPFTMKCHHPIMIPSLLPAKSGGEIATLSFGIGLSTNYFRRVNHKTRILKKFAKCRGKAVPGKSEHPSSDTDAHVTLAAKTLIHNDLQVTVEINDGTIGGTEDRHFRVLEISLDTKPSPHFFLGFEVDEDDDFFKNISEEDKITDATWLHAQNTGTEETGIYYTEIFVNGLAIPVELHEPIAQKPDSAAAAKAPAEAKPAEPDTETKK